MKTVNDNEAVNPQCAAEHFGPWLAEPTWLNSQVEAWRAGHLHPVAATMAVESDGRPLYSVGDDGIAQISLEGPLMRGESKFGGTSTVRTRRALREASRDSEVEGVMLNVSSPGGTVPGTDELASDMRLTNRSKPVYVHAEGTMASAAYWIGIQGRRVSATRMTHVGSIGVVAVIEDRSGQFDKEGIVTHVVGTGKLKGAFQPGTEVTEDHLSYARELIGDTFKVFRREVMERRNMDAEAFDAVGGEEVSGRVWLASESRKLGLIDAVESKDAAMSALRGEVTRIQTDRQKRSRRMQRLKS